MRLRHRVQLQKETSTQDAAGQPIQAWTTYRTCWADVSDESASQGGGDETSRSQFATVGTVVTIMYPHADSIPTSLDRVVHTEGGVTRTLNIEGVERVDGARRMLRLICSEDGNG